MKKILLLVDQKARDLASVLLIGEYLRTFGLKAYYCNKGNMLAMALKVKPDIMVFSCSEGNYNDLARHIAPHCKIVLMTQEGACATKESTVLRHTFKGLSETCYIKGLSRVYLWNEASRQWLAEENVYPAEIVRVVGTSRLDPYRMGGSRRPRKTGALRVGIANRGAAVNPSTPGNPIELLDACRLPVGSHRAYVDKDREWEDYVWHSSASVRVTLDIVEALCKNSQYEVILRPDPYEAPSSYKFLERRSANFRVNADPILYNYIDEIDVLLTEFSTTGVEALLLNKPVISFQRLLGPRLPEHNSKPNHLNPEQMQLYWQPNTREELQVLLDKAQAGQLACTPKPNELRAYLQHYYDWPRAGSSSARLIAQDLAELAVEEKPVSLQEFHQRDFMEHPRLVRVARNSHLPKFIARFILSSPWIDDIRLFWSAYRSGNLANFERSEFFWWNRSEIRSVLGIFDALKRIDDRDAGQSKTVGRASGRAVGSL